MRESDQPVGFAPAPSCWLTGREQGGVVIFLCFLGRRDVAGGDDIGSALDRRLDGCSMECVQSQRDEEIVSNHGSF
jgi:hypothetical protein